MRRGQRVQVTECGGRKLIRRFIRDNGRTIEICNEAEYRAAVKEKREPEGVGFPREAVRIS